MNYTRPSFFISYLFTFLLLPTFCYIQTRYMILDLHNPTDEAKQKLDATYWTAANTNPNYITSDTWINYMPSSFFLGCAGVLEYNGQFSRTYDHLPPHNSLFFSFRVVLIDNWSAGDKIYFVFSDKEGPLLVSIAPLTVYDRTQFYTNFDGDSNMPDEPVDGIIQINHSGNTLKVDVIMDTVPAALAYLAINRISITFFSQSVEKNWAWVRDYLLVPSSSRGFTPYSSSPLITRNWLTTGCDPSCKYCFAASSSTSCFSCATGYAYNDGECISCIGGANPEICQSCDLGFHPEETACIPNCPMKCDGCSAPYICTSCQEGYYFNSNDCKQCDITCKTCSGPQVNQCLSCKPSLFLHANSTCIPQEKTSLVSETEAIRETTGLIGSVGLVIANAMNSGSPGGISIGVLMKMFEYIKYIDVTHSEELEKALETWGSSFVSLKMSPDIPDKLQKKIKDYPLPWMFEKYSVSSSLLINFWSNLFMISVVSVFYGAFFAMERIIARMKEKTIILKRLVVMAQNMLVSQLYSSLGDIIFFSVLEFRSSKNVRGYNILSFIIASFFVCVCFGIIIMHILFLRKQQRVRKQCNKDELEGFYKRYEGVKVVFEDFKDESWSQQGFLLLFTSRDIIFSILLTTLFQYPLIQIILIVLMNILMILYLIMKRPFNKLFEEMQQIFFEVVLLAMNISIFILAISESIKLINGIGKFIIITSTSINLVILVLLLIKTGLTIQEVYQARKAKKIQKQLPNTLIIRNQGTSSFTVDPNQSIDNPLMVLQTISNPEELQIAKKYNTDRSISHTNSCILNNTDISTTTLSNQLSIHQELPSFKISEAFHYHIDRRIDSKHLRFNKNLQRARYGLGFRSRSKRMNMSSSRTPQILEESVNQNSCSPFLKPPALKDVSLLECNLQRSPMLLRGVNIISKKEK